MLKVLGKSTSINVRKVLWTCSELALNYELEEWGNQNGELLKAEFLALNPNALVPVITDEDFVLWESNSICRYLASSMERWDLLPRSPKPKAHVEQWMDWQATELNNSWRYAFMALVRKNPSYSEDPAIDTSVRNWNQNMMLLERQLERSGDFILGSEFSLADIGIGLSTHRWLSTPMERPELPTVQAYYQRLSQRKGFVEHGCNGVP
ncbi:glutathione S-transferase [Agarivorans sp. TSD2052]|uniref:glutathione S-transferase family protein n=1 Tax=Agarivorans sp. TSD2052 TaxID=2937286 RepID=UPI00200C9B6C|nr:glutathione S-transferase [Agarivorans sp. TSD2052]UPW17097.1 glutathione S-transferase [Agarivorans sp. TSD2052]